MKLLYACIDQRVPGAHGGAVHVESVAEGLAALGHEVHVIATPGNGASAAGLARWHGATPPLGIRQLRLLRVPRLVALARALRPDAVIERYYNFGGEGLIAARQTGAAAVLEVNAPVVDYPGSSKRRMDRLMVIEPLRRWRERQCGMADLIVTPEAAILPAGIPRDKILELEWGADTTRFRPGIIADVPFPREPGDTIVVFAGAFRAWHGAIHLVGAIERLRARRRHDIKALLIGEGPELRRVREAAVGLSGVTFTGPVPHRDMPAWLAAADVGVAPFDVAAYRPLSLGFYWSPLKVFEYMASGLPVVAPAIDRLRRLVEDGREGILYDPSDAGSLAAALERAADPRLRTAMGAAARLRAERDFSWQAHCRKLEAGIRLTIERSRRQKAHHC